MNGEMCENRNPAKLFLIQEEKRKIVLRIKATRIYADAGRCG